LVLLKANEDIEMKKTLEQLLSGLDLDTAAMSEAFAQIMQGECSDAQIGAFLATLRMKGETVAEVAAAASIMRKHATFVDSGARSVIDTCGTGGTGLHTFNISTASAFVSAGAGVAVAKHGNRAISGNCGSADVLAQMGFNLDVKAAIMEECLQEQGIAFLFAPNMHPSMKNVMPARKSLGIRTIFNMLGPLSNPAGASGQVIGVFSPELTEMFAKVLGELGSKRAIVVHGEDGLDEITTSGETRVSELRDGQVKTYNLDAELLLGRTWSLQDIRGESAEYNGQVLQEVLQGKEGPYRDVVLLNSAAALIVGEKADTMQQAIEIAKESIDSGAAMQKLQTLIEYSKG
jgi:anthranilate phosphoribosyltransferase